MRLGAIPHGTDNGYSNYDCRCQHCRTAHAAYQRDYIARRALPVDPHVELLNAAVMRARPLTWQAVYAAGRATAVCDEIIRNRPIPARLYAAVLAVDLPEAA